MIILDTNVVSELMRPLPEPSVLRWVNRQVSDTLWLTSIAVSELLFGVARLPEGARKRQFAQAMADLLEHEFIGRVLPFDLESAVVYAELVARREREGKPVAMADAQIAAICIANSAALATRNQRHFAGLGLPVLDPWVVGAA